jgi:hypothetical protein
MRLLAPCIWPTEACETSLSIFQLLATPASLQSAIGVVTYMYLSTELARVAECVSVSATVAACSIDILLELSFPLTRVDTVRGSGACNF